MMQNHFFYLQVSNILGVICYNIRIIPNCYDNTGAMQYPPFCPDNGRQEAHGDLLLQPLLWFYICYLAISSFLCKFAMQYNKGCKRTFTTVRNHLIYNI